MSSEDQGDMTIVIDGVASEDLALTFKEQRRLRQMVREMTGDPEAEVESAALMDWIPALVCITRQRANPEYTLEEAMNTTLDDYLKAAPKTRARPTKQA